MPLIWDAPTDPLRKASVEDALLPHVVIEPAGSPRSAVVWLHGLGADGHDFEAIVPHLGLEDSLGIRFVFPHAPRIPVTINSGMVMPAWYDITGLDFDRRHDEVGIRRSADQVAALIADQIDRGIPSERIVLAGFSQGGAIALFEGLRHEEPLAGIVALSTYVVLEDAIAQERDATRTGIPIFQAHGSFDPMVGIDRGRRAHETLVGWGYQPSFHEYPMEHAVCGEEIDDLGAWFASVLA